MGLIDLREKLAEAKSVYENAEKEYKESMLSLIESGAIKERVASEWKEFYSAKCNKTMYYCRECSAVLELKYRFCPDCGADMINGTALIRRFDQSMLNKDTEPCKRTRNRKESSFSNYDEGHDIVAELIKNGFSISEIARESGVSYSTVSRFHLPERRKMDEASILPLRKLRDNLGV